MRTETGIMECLEARQRSTALLNWHISPEDESSETQQALADEMTKILTQRMGWVPPAMFLHNHCGYTNSITTKIGKTQRSIERSQNT